MSIHQDPLGRLSNTGGELEYADPSRRNRIRMGKKECFNTALFLVGIMDKIDPYDSTFLKFNLSHCLAQNQ